MTTSWPLLDPKAVVQKLMGNGPDRVVVDAEGLGERWSVAHAKGIETDVIFIRRDGWTCGAPRRFAAVAYWMWADEWVAFIDRREPLKVRPIVEYHS